MESFRQTKSTWWSITAFNDNISRIENKDGIPAVIKCVYGGREECPKTGRLHYQGAIQCAAQCRASVILDWLPGAHIEKAQSSIALRKYAMKEETAVGEKTEWVNPMEYMTMDKCLELMGKTVVKWTPMSDIEYKKIVEEEYWYGVRTIIKEKPSLIAPFSQPQMYRAWVHTRSVWTERAKSIVLQPAINEDKKPEFKIHSVSINEDQIPLPSQI